MPAIGANVPATSRACEAHPLKHQYVEFSAVQSGSYQVRTLDTAAEWSLNQSAAIRRAD